MPASVTSHCLVLSCLVLSLFNDKADLLARQALQELPTTSRNPFTLPTWKSLTIRQITQCWQIRWDRSTTDRATYDVLQVVGNRTVFPNNRNVAISYVRLLLSDTTFREHQYHMGLVDTKLCEKDDGIEDVYHFFFQCARYSDIRDKLEQDIQSIWTDSVRNRSPRCPTLRPGALPLDPAGVCTANPII